MVHPRRLCRSVKGCSLTVNLTGGPDQLARETKRPVCSARQIRVGLKHVNPRHKGRFTIGFRNQAFETLGVARVHLADIRFEGFTGRQILLPGQEDPPH